MIANQKKATMIQAKPVSERSEDIELKLDEADEAAVDESVWSRLSDFRRSFYI